MEEEKFNYTQTNAIFNIANTTNDFISSPNVNYTANISSKVNDAILLSEAYFIVEYKISNTKAGGGTSTGVLIPNWFLSMLNSINFSINSYNFQLNSINQGRTFPMLVQTYRYLQYEQGDFNKYASTGREIFQKRYGAGPSFGESINYYPTEVVPTESVVRQLVLNLRDILPVAGTLNQVNGLLSFSMVLSYNKDIHSQGVELGSFAIQKINFHYPVRTYNHKEIVDYDLSYISTYGVLQGVVPKTESFTFNPSLTYDYGSQSADVAMSNIQLSVNQIYKIMI